MRCGLSAAVRIGALGKCGHMARRVRPPTEKCGHTSLFRCMVALWLAGQSLAPGQRRTDSFRRWVETHEDALFLPGGLRRRKQGRSQAFRRERRKRGALSDALPDHGLMADTRFPFDWRAQRAALGFA
jgi:hypothetical protein